MLCTHCRTRTERQIAKYCPFKASIDTQKAYLIIGRLLEVKGDSVKAIQFLHEHETQLKIRGTLHAKRTNMGGPPRKHLVNAC